MAPNPSTNYFTLNITTNTSYPITIAFYNSQGILVDRVVKTGTNITLTIGTTWAKGTYYAVVEQGSVRRLVTLVEVVALFQEKDHPMLYHKAPPSAGELFFNLMAFHPCQEVSGF